MKNSAMNTSIFSPVYSVDEPMDCSPPVIPQLMLDPKVEENEYEEHRMIVEQEERSQVDNILYQDHHEEQDHLTRTSELGQLSSQIQLDIPHILNPTLNHNTIGELASQLWL